TTPATWSPVLYDCCVGSPKYSAPGGLAARSLLTDQPASEFSCANDTPGCADPSKLSSNRVSVSQHSAVGSVNATHARSTQRFSVQRSPSSHCTDVTHSPSAGVPSKSCSPVFGLSSCVKRDFTSLP